MALELEVDDLEVVEYDDAAPLPLLAELLEDREDRPDSKKLSIAPPLLVGLVPEPCVDDNRERFRFRPAPLFVEAFVDPFEVAALEGADPLAVEEPLVSSHPPCGSYLENISLKC